MRLLTLSQLRFFRFAPWSTLTVLLGVTLAVASIVAVHQISRRVVDSLTAVMPPYLESISHLLTRPGLTMDDYFALRREWRDGALPAVTGLMPLVDGNVLVDVDADAGGAGPERRMRLVGVDPFSGVDAVRGLALLPPGALVAGAGQGLETGSTLELNGHRLRLAMIHESVPAGMLVTDVGTAQVALGRSDRALSRIAVVVDSGSRRLETFSDRILPGLSAGLSLPDWSLPGWQVVPVSAELPDLAFARSVLFNLGALGSLALVVAWLLVYQVGVIWLRRRALTLTRMRQMGVSERELGTGFLISLLTLGLIASGTGLWVGDMLAHMLARAATGYSGATDPLPGLDVWVCAKAIVSAALVCLIGGWFAFRRESGGRRNPMWRGALAIVLVGAAFWGVGVSSSLLGAFVAIGAAALIVLLAVRPLLEQLRRQARRLAAPPLARIGLRELLWYPGDLAVALGALLLALATSVAMALMVDSFKSDFVRMLDQRLDYDFYVDGDDRDLEALAASLVALPGVSRVAGYGRAEQRWAGQLVEVGYARFDARESRRYGLSSPLPRGACLLSERLARAAGVAAGARIELGGSALLVAGTFPGFGEARPRLLVNTADARRLGIVPVYDRLSLDVEPAAPAALDQVVQRLAPGASVQDQAAIRSRALAIFDQTFAITGALTGLSLIVAAVGLYNALLALKLLQQPAHRLLKAMGVTARERLAVDLWRITGVGLAAVLLALPLGAVMGWLLCEVVNPRAFGWSLDLEASVSAFTWPVVSAVLAMACVALLPMPLEESVHEA